MNSRTRYWHCESNRSSAIPLELLRFFSVEYDCLIPVNEHPILNVPPHGPGQHDFLEIATFAYEILDAVAMGAANNVLLDDGALIEFVRHVVGGDANNLHAPFMGLVIGFAANERRKK